MATTIQQFVTALDQISKKRTAEIATKMVSGRLTTLEEYKMEAGRAAGITEMADLAYQLMKNRDLAEDDDDGKLSGMPGKDNGGEA